MIGKPRVFALFVVFVIMSFSFTSLVLAGSTTVTSTGIKFPDGTTQTTAATGGGSSLWSQSGSDIYYNDGNVSIGTTTPTWAELGAIKFAVGGDFFFGDSECGLLGYRNGNTMQIVGVDITDSTFNNIHLRANKSPGGVFLKTNGYVGIGTTSPEVTLHVKGPDGSHAGIIMDSGGGNSNYIFSENGSAKWRIRNEASDDALRFWNGADTINPLTILSNGYIGIGTSSPSYPLEMASGAHVTTAGVWTNASSREYKENIRDLSYDEATLALLSLKPSKFNYKVDKDDDYLGFIAEDVPDLVATKDRKGLSPMDIVAVLTKVVQKQQKEYTVLNTKFQQQQKENAVLNTKLAAIMSRLEALEK